MTAGITLTTITLNAPDPLALATFYARLLGWPTPQTNEDEPEWISLRNPDGSVGLAVQMEDKFVEPVWPARADAQQMTMHLEIRVDDLAAALAHAQACGATAAEYQPQDDVRVCLDPVGHPFCLWVETSS